MNGKASLAALPAAGVSSEVRFQLYSSWPKITFILLTVQVVLSFIFGNGTALNGYYEVVYLTLLLFGTGLSALNAIQSRQPIRLFWSFFAGAFGLWALLPIFSMYQVVLHRWGSPLWDMTPGFLHIVLFIAAVAARPHLKLPTEKPYRATLSFLMLLFFGVFVYLYVLAPYVYDQHASALIVRYELLYFAANLLLLSLLVLDVLRTQPPWKSVYGHLLGASTMYAGGSLVANLAWASGHNHFGGLTGLPFTASISWFVWVTLQGQEMAGLERSAPRDTTDTRPALVLAMLALLAIPLIGMFELFREGEQHQIRVIRLVLVQVSVVFLGVVTFVRAFLANRDLASGMVLANDRLRLAVEAGKMYACEWDAATDRIVLSVECAHILDWMDQPTTDTREGMLAHLHPEDRHLFDASVSTLNPSNANFQIRYRVLRPDGNTIWLEHSGHALFDNKGRMLGTVGMVKDVTERKRMEEALEKVSGQLIEAQEKERRRLARELHDDICQRLAILSLKIAKVSKGWGNGRATASAQLERIRKQCSELTRDVQALSHELHPSTLDILGLHIAATDFCREFSEETGTTVEFTAKNVPPSLPRDVELSLFRVIQEALHNASKYSGEKCFAVHLEAKAGEIELVVSDRGTGFDADGVKSGAGLGLVSMRERIHLLHGRITIESQPNKGTRICASVPLSSDAKVVSAAAN
jgi:signal transduction histidine kinase